MSLVLASPSCGPVSISLETSGFFCRHWTKEVWESGVRADPTLSEMDVGEPGATQASVPQAHHFKPESSGSSWSPQAGDCHFPSLPPPPAHLCWHSVSQASSCQTFLPSKWAFRMWASPPRLFMMTPAHTDRSLPVPLATLTWNHPQKCPLEPPMLHCLPPVNPSPSEILLHHSHPPSSLTSITARSQLSSTALLLPVQLGFVMCSGYTSPA